MSKTPAKTWRNDRIYTRLWELRKEKQQLKDELRATKEALRTLTHHEDRVWIDAERRLWFAHRCLDVMAEDELKGWWIRRSGTITPSIRCQRCGAHLYAQIQVRLHYMEDPWEYPRAHEGRKGDSNGSSQGDHPEGDQDLRVQWGAGGPGRSEGGVQGSDEDRGVHGLGGGVSGEVEADS